MRPSISIALAVAMSFACDSAERDRLRDQAQQQRTIEALRAQVASLKSKADQAPKELTRERAASLIERDTSFARPMAGPGFEQCYRSIVEVGGIAHDSPTVAFADFVWRPRWRD